MRYREYEEREAAASQRELAERLERLETTIVQLEAVATSRCHDAPQGRSKRSASASMDSRPDGPQAGKAAA